MVPTKLTLSNFMCYRADGAADGPPCLVLDGLHVVCLSGENGAGKSALLDAITWALWGEARMADDDLIAQGQGEMSVDLEFQLGDQCYRVIRRRQRGGTGKRGGQAAGKSQLDLQVHNGEAWRPMGEIGVRETQAAINDLLRMSYQTFINAAFLLQGRADEFTARTPGERKEVLADILDLGEYEALATKAKERAKDLDGRLRSLRGEMEGLRESAGQLGFWASQVAEADQRRERLSAEVAAAEQARAAAISRRGHLETRAEQRKELLRRLELLRREQGEREHELRALGARIAQAEATLARAPAIHVGLEELAAARAEIVRLDQLREEHQRLIGERQQLQAELKTAQAELKTTLAHAAARRDALAAAAARRDALATTIAEAAARLEALQPAAEERARCAQERQAIEGELARLAELRLRRGQLVSRIEKRQDALVGAREEQGRLVKRLEKQLAREPDWLREREAAQVAAAHLAQAEADLAELRRDAQTAAEEQGTLRAEIKRLGDQGKELAASQTTLDAGAGVCPTCRSELGPEHLAHVHAFYADELAGLRERYAEAQRRQKEGEAAQARAQGSIRALEAKAAALGRAVAGLKSLDDQLAQAVEWREELARARATHDDLGRQIAAKEFDPQAQADLADLEQQIAAVGEAEELSRRRTRLDERLAELDQALRESERIGGSLTMQRQSLAEAEAAAADLPPAQAEAATIEARIAAGDFAPEVRARGRAVEAALTALGYSQESHAAADTRARALADWEREERELLVAEQRLVGDRESLAKSDLLRRRDAEEVERMTRDDAVLEQELRDLPQALAAAEQAEAALKERQQTLQVAQNDLGQKQGYLRVAQAAADRLTQREAEERALAERQGLFAELAEAFGKKGVQAMLIETAIPQIEDEANRLLGRMTDGQMHLSFEMQRDTKKGDTVETLEIKIADALGTRVYDAFSGGEAMRANFAVRIALSRLLARRAGARLETLVIDEGFGTLDALGRERMVEAITSVQDDFRRIIVITHIDELKDRFPVHIEVTKTPLGSMWELR